MSAVYIANYLIVSYSTKYKNYVYGTYDSYHTKDVEETVATIKELEDTLTDGIVLCADVGLHHKNLGNMTGTELGSLAKAFANAAIVQEIQKEYETKFQATENFRKYLEQDISYRLYHDSLLGFFKYYAYLLSCAAILRTIGDAYREYLVNDMNMGKFKSADVLFLERKPNSDTMVDYNSGRNTNIVFLYSMVRIALYIRPLKIELIEANGYSEDPFDGIDFSVFVDNTAGGVGLGGDQKNPEFIYDTMLIKNDRYPDNVTEYLESLQDSGLL